MFHANLTDAPLLSPLFGWLGVNGPIDPWRAIAINNANTLAFFDRPLGGRPAPLLDGVIRPNPEVSLEQRPQVQTNLHNQNGRKATARRAEIGRLALINPGRHQQWLCGVGV